MTQPHKVMVRGMLECLAKTSEGRRCLNISRRGFETPGWGGGGVGGGLSGHHISNKKCFRSGAGLNGPFTAHHRGEISRTLATGRFPAIFPFAV